jgi:hypothetical protein
LIKSLLITCPLFVLLIELKQHEERKIPAVWRGRALSITPPPVLRRFVPIIIDIHLAAMEATNSINRMTLKWFVFGEAHPIRARSSLFLSRTLMASIYSAARIRSIFHPDQTALSGSGEVLRPPRPDNSRSPEKLPKCCPRCSFREGGLTGATEN